MSAPVRPAVVTDAAEFVRLKAEIMTRHYPFPVDLDAHPEWFDQAAATFVGLVGRPDYAQFVVDDASRPGALIGSISVALIRYLPGLEWPGTHAHVSDMCVEEACRGRGIGRALMAAALDWARAQGAGSARLDATPGAIPVYTALGFQRHEGPELFPTMRMRLDDAAR